MRWVLTCLCLLGLAAAPPVGVLAAGDLSAGDVAGGDLSPAARQAAEDAYRAKDYDAALPRLLPFAEAGEAKAQQQVGRIFVHDGADLQQALEWYRKAAEQNYPPAITSLGVMYERGDGVPKDATQATMFYKRAAELGYARAQAYYGQNLDLGTGVAKDSKAARMWIERAAKQCSVIGLVTLAAYHSTRIGDANFNAMIRWRYIAVLNGFEETFHDKFAFLFYLTSEMEREAKKWVRQNCNPGTE